MAKDPTVRAVIKGDTRQAQASMSKFGSKVDTVKAKTVGMNKAMSGFVSGIGAMTAGLAIGVLALDGLATHATEVSNVMGGLKINLDKTSAAVGHQISQLEIAKSANKLMAAGIDVTDEKMAKFGKTVAMLADAQGVDLATAMKKATKGIIKGSEGALLASGIYSDLATEATLAGRTFTIAERQQRVWNTTLEAGAVVADNAGVSINGLGQRWTVAKTKLTDFTNELIAGGNGMDNAADKTDGFIATLGPMGMVLEANIQAFRLFTNEATMTAAEGFDILTDSIIRTKGEMNALLGPVAKLQAENKKLADITQANVVKGTTKALEAGFNVERDFQGNVANVGLKGGKKKGKGGGRKQEFEFDELGAARGLGQIRENQLKRETDALQVAHDAEVEIRTQKIQLLEAEGAAEDKIFAARLELAEFEGNAFEEKIIRAEHETTLHEQRVERAKEEAEAFKQAEAKKMEAIKLRVATQKMAAALTTQTLDFVLAAQSAFGEKNLKLVEAVESGKMFINAGVKVAEAIGSIASYNYVAAALQFASAATFTAEGIAIATSSRRRSASVGSARGGAGGAGAGPVDTSGGAGGGAGVAPGGAEGGDVPISPLDPSLTRGGAANGAANGGVNIQVGTVIGGSASDVATSLKHLMEDGEQQSGETI